VFKLLFLFVTNLGVVLEQGCCFITIILGIRDDISKKFARF
jgi:hypothetical protein